MGIDLDLDRALQKSVREVIDFLVEEHGLTPAKAFSLASLAVDFEIAEAVDLTQVVSGHVPKSLFQGRCGGRDPAPAHFACVLRVGVDETSLRRVPDPLRGPAQEPGAVRG